MKAKDRLKKFRENQGLTRKEMADILGVLPSKIQDVETGKQRVNEDFLNLVSEKCNIDAGYLLTGRQTGPSILPKPLTDHTSAKAVAEPEIANYKTGFTIGEVVIAYEKATQETQAAVRRVLQME